MVKVVVTGGASFIGSHLVERLLNQGDQVTVLDNMSSGDLTNLSRCIQNPNLAVFQPDLRNCSLGQMESFFDKARVVYHLAADHGGRGYVELHQVNCSNNFVMDNNVIMACIQMKNSPRIVFASSGCIYPMNLQTDTSQMLYLTEADAGPPFEPDGLYGMAKLAGELTLKKAHEEFKLESTSCRFFTVYGPRAKENHAVISFIARAYAQKNPFTVWGDGTQVRNWTYVDDIVNGLVLAAGQRGCNVMNLGTTERITVEHAMQLTIAYANEYYYSGDYDPEIAYDLTKPTGPMNRVADNGRYLNLNPPPLMTFRDGLLKTMQWYFGGEHNTEDLDRLLIARK